MDETPDAPQDVRPDVVDPPLTLVRHKSVPPSRKGQKGAGGRPRGARNKVTLQIREAAARLFDDPVYWRKLRRRRHRIPPAVYRSDPARPQLKLGVLNGVVWANRPIR